MNDRAKALAEALIRNFNDAPMDRFVREPLYDCMGTRLGNRGKETWRLG